MSAAAATTRQSAPTDAWVAGPTDALDRARLKVQLAWLAERRSNIALAVRRARSAAALLEAPGIPPDARDVCLAEARTIEGHGPGAGR